jgi:hypothetical protein
MATGVCIYCGRTLDVQELLDKAGKFRCKNEQDCLDYQIGDDAAGNLDDPEYWPSIVKSALSDAAERLSAYGTRKDTAGIGDSAEESGWMRAVIDALAAEYREKPRFAFRYDESGNSFAVSFGEADQGSHFTAQIAILAGTRYALTVAGAERSGDPAGVYREFIYKTYPVGLREDALRDLSVVLLAFEAEEGARPALLCEFRREIESRCCSE